MGCSTICCVASHRHETVTRVDGLHLALAHAAVAGAANGIDWSAILVATRRTGGPAFERLRPLLSPCSWSPARSGLATLAAGARPADGLHLMYPIGAIALIPLARSLLIRSSGRGPAAFLLVAFVVPGGVLYRLFTTG